MALLLGLVGTEVELLLLEHYEDAWQLVPLVLIGMGLASVLWHTMSPRLATARSLQATMVAFLVAGGAGVYLHGRGAAEFQREIDPAQNRWTMAWKVMRAKAPPLLAPGLMVQLGLLGLLYGRRSE